MARRNRLTVLPVRNGGRRAESTWDAAVSRIVRRTEDRPHLPPPGILAG